MFGIDFPELIIILVIALILFGPEKLPEYSQKLGQMVYKWKRAYTNLQRTMYMPPELSHLSSLDSPYQENLCPKCRRPVGSDFMFCPACGERLKGAPVTEQASPADQGESTTAFPAEQAGAAKAPSADPAKPTKT